MTRAGCGQVAQGRWLALGGGGYAGAQVLPRAWTHVLAIAAHAPVEPTTPLPAGWRRTAREVFGHDAPTTMGDGVLPTVPVPHDGEGADPVDRVVAQVRRTVLARHEPAGAGEDPPLARAEGAHETLGDGRSGGDGARPPQ